MSVAAWEQAMFTDDEWADYRKWHRELLETDRRRWFREVLRMESAYKWPWLMDLLTEYGGSSVARGKGNAQTAPAKNNAQWTMFVDISMAGREWSEVVKAFGGANQIDDGLDALLRDGYRVSFVHNPSNDAVICSVTCKATNTPNEGKTFNAFAGTWVEALQTALFKHYVVSNMVWGEADGKAARPAFG